MSANGRLPRGYLIGFAMRLVGGSPLPPPSPLAAPTCSQPRWDRTPPAVFRPLTDSASSDLPAQDRRWRERRWHADERGGDASASALSVAAQLAYPCAAPHLLVRLALGGTHPLPEGGYLLWGSVYTFLCRLPTLISTRWLQRHVLASERPLLAAPRPCRLSP
jgi:hypothetical protein